MFAVGELHYYEVLCNRVRSRFEFQVGHSNQSITLSTDQRYTFIFFLPITRIMNRAGSSKTAPRISIFSIVLGQRPLSYLLLLMPSHFLGTLFQS